MEHEDLIDLEQQGWQALMAEPAAARKFYDGVFDERVVLLLSDLPPIRVREAALDALCGADWEEFRLHGLRCVRLGESTGVVRYSIAATRSALPYSAQVSSVYARRPGGWKLTFHQRTRR
ncbi:nuclear transport factor 2 family protein [Amycolatopsis sp. NPDC026612]|uniref:nuclear transport factor 2 family protein n=1 Tax=Amycolatopsis sp. NPDC026612 TaxID=3155466 RepID=UPI0033FE6708